MFFNLEGWRKKSESSNEADGAGEESAPEAGKNSLSEESAEETITETFANYAASAITIPEMPAAILDASSIMTGCSNVGDSMDADLRKVEETFSDIVFLHESYSEDYGTSLLHTHIHAYTYHTANKILPNILQKISSKIFLKMPFKKIENFFSKILFFKKSLKILAVEDSLKIADDSNRYKGSLDLSESYIGIILTWMYRCSGFW